MNFLRTFTGIRANKWWHFKINIFVSFILLAGIGITHQPSTHQWLLWLLFLLALLPGATYVSLINDYTDYQQDRLANKISGIDLIGKKRSLAILFFSLVLGILVTCLFPVSIKARLFYAAAWIAFSMYSIPPIRLKNRGVLGILADASGAHLFPILFLFAAIQHNTFNATTAILIGTNVVCFGLRGILWHQFTDKQNDLHAGVKTLVTEYNNTTLQQAARLFLLLECAAFIGYVIIHQHYFILLSIVCYALYLLIIHRTLHIELVVSAVKKNGPWIFVTGTYYQFFLPITLLLFFSVNKPLILLTIPLFMWMFPVITKQHIQHLKQIKNRFIKNAV